MKKLPDPTPDTPSIDGLRDAIARATPDTAPRWGTMTSPQMLKHCREFVDLYMGRAPVAAPMRWLARWLGPVFLTKTMKKSPTATPRNLSTIPSIKARSGAALDFEVERRRLLEALDEIAALKGTHDHPLYGPTAAEDVVALVRHHTAHHMNQFGLLPATQNAPTS